MKDWISVKDGLPTETGRYLVAQKSPFKNRELEVELFWFDPQRRRNPFYFRDLEWGNVYVYDVTHWMPLPEVPKEEAEK